MNSTLAAECLSLRPVIEELMGLKDKSLTQKTSKVTLQEVHLPDAHCGVTYLLLAHSSEFCRLLNK